MSPNVYSNLAIHRAPIVNADGFLDFNLNEVKLPLRRLVQPNPTSGDTGIILGGPYTALRVKPMGIAEGSIPDHSWGAMMLPFGAVYNVNETLEGGSWINVKLEGNWPKQPVGYLRTNQFIFLTEGIESPRSLVLNEFKAHAIADSNVVFTFPKGSLLPGYSRGVFTGIDGLTFKIMHPDPDSLVRLTTKQRTSAELIKSIDSWVGTPYMRHGFTGHGIDCCRFLRHVFHEFDIKLPFSTSDYSKDTLSREITDIKVIPSLREAKTGDLITYKGHVGIFISDETESKRCLIAHATSKGGVRKEPVTEAGTTAETIKIQYSSILRIADFI